MSLSVRLYEETTGTLLCGDLFSQAGDGPALIESDIVGPAIAAEDMFNFSSLNPATGATIRKLAELSPRTLALMHGRPFSAMAPPHSAHWPTTTTTAFSIGRPRRARSRPPNTNGPKS